MTTGEGHNPGEAIIELLDTHKRLGRQQVFDGVSLKLRAGETTVVIGESGVGKSVLLKHIIGLMRPDRGQVFYKHTRIDVLPDKALAKFRRNFGFLFQLSALFDSMTAGANVAFPLVQQTKKSDADIRRVVKEKLAMVGLDGIQAKMPAELSGGQKKRAIAMDPEVILYDEPTTGLDPIRADGINELILKLQREIHVTSIVVTHDMASVYKVADRIVMLHQGKFIFDGTSEEIRNTRDERVRQFVEGRAGDEDRAGLD